MQITMTNKYGETGTFPVTLKTEPGVEYQAVITDDATGIEHLVMSACDQFVRIMSIGRFGCVTKTIEPTELAEFYTLKCYRGNGTEMEPERLTDPVEEAWFEPGFTVFS